MPLHHFRKRKQLIYWVITICVVPAFVLVWGTGKAFRQRGMADPTVAVVAGDRIGRIDFYEFQSPGGTGRLPAAVGTRGVRLKCSNFAFRSLAGAFNPKSREDIRFLYARVSTVLLLAMLRQAEAVGIDVSPMEVDSYIKNKFFGNISNPVRLKKAYHEHLRQLRMNSRDFKRGVREWIKIRRFARLLDQTLPASGLDAYLLYARAHTRCTYTRLQVRITAKMREEAIDEVAGKSKEHPAPDPEVLNAAVEKYIAEHPADRDLWTRARWRLQWVLAPYDALPVTVTAAHVEQYFKRHPREFEGKKLDDAGVYEKVQERVKRQKRREAALRTLRGEFMSYLRQMLGAKQPITLAGISAQAGLKRRGVRTGVSGAKAMTTDELKADKVIGDSEDLRRFLDALDAMEDGKQRRERVRKLQASFDDRRVPFTCKQGMFRIRLLEYQPGKPRPLRDAKGRLDQQLRMVVVNKLQQEAAARRARKLAEEYAARLKTGVGEELKALETKTADYTALDRELRRSPLGVPKVRTLRDGKRVTGYEVLAMRKREYPSFAKFSSLPADERRRYEQMAAWRWQGYILPFDWQSGYTSISAGPTLSQWIDEEIKSGRIQLLWSDSGTKPNKQ